jgi:2-polyprenyl-6-methoxyphenol hydroxylase-like FAD-dependent oxidoreductase
VTRSECILIAGAGPTGLTAAIELARRGIRPRIVSANDGPVHESRALGINRRSLTILEPCGATVELLKIGLRVKGIHLRTAERELLHIELPGQQNRLPFLLVVPQSEIEEVLVEVLRGLGVEVEWRTELVSLSDAETNPVAELRGPGGTESVSADILIGADGAHSTVRRALGLGFPGAAYETEWGLADAHVRTALPLDEATAFDLAPVLFVMIPIRENFVRFISDHRDVLAHVPQVIEVLEVEWESPFRISHRQVETYQKGSVFLAGDAAHIHSPVGARGMNLGIEDAAWLAWLIAEGGTERYTAERHPVGRRVLRTVDPATRLMASDALVPKFLRRNVLPRLASIMAVRNRFIARVVGLDTPPPPWLAAVEDGRRGG